MGSKWALAGGGFNPQGILHSVHVPELSPDVEALELQREEVVRACMTRARSKAIPTGAPFALFKTNERADTATVAGRALDKAGSTCPHVALRHRELLMGPWPTSTSSSSSQQ